MEKSDVWKKIFSPLTKEIINNDKSRNCKKTSDKDFLKIGLHRVLGNDKSGRCFLQRAKFDNITDIERSHFFKSLKSKRRLSHLMDSIRSLSGSSKKILSLEDPFTKFKELDKFEIYASDGSYYQWACHDIKYSKKKNKDEMKSRDDEHKSSKRSCQHFYASNLRTKEMAHLISALMDAERIKEHDMHALKRLSHKELRMGVPKGKKVLHVYDRAGMDFPQWERWKSQSGIYFLTREKQSNKLSILGTPDYDKNDSVNLGVTADHMVGTSNSYSFRRVIYTCPDTGYEYKFVTNLPFSIRPGIIVQLYKSRWEVEKAFDSFKNKLEEKKAWGSSDTAKTMQANFICLAYNLSLILNSKIEREHGISYKHDINRKAKGLKKKQKKILEKGARYPSTWSTCLRPSHLTVKFYRWIRAYICKETLWLEAISKLGGLYDEF